MAVEDKKRFLVEYNHSFQSQLFSVQNPFSKERLKEILSETAGDRVALFVYHDVVNNRMNSIPFEEQVKMIYDYGGQCITFSELSECVDPLKAYAYTH